MDLTPKYLTFTEYNELGGTLDEGAFLPLEYRAEKKIDTYTFNRLNGLETIPNEVKMCVFDLIPMIDEDNSNILSESVGSYSITRKDRNEQNNSVKDLILTYLSNTKVNDVPVLYIGTDEN